MDSVSTLFTQPFINSLRYNEVGPILASNLGSPMDSVSTLFTQPFIN
jgi:hypothetical protein